MIYNAQNLDFLLWSDILGDTSVLLIEVMLFSKFLLIFVSIYLPADQTINILLSICVTLNLVDSDGKVTVKIHFDPTNVRCVFNTGWQRVTFINRPDIWFQYPSAKFVIL